MFIIVSKYLIPKGYSGLTLFPFIFISEYSLKADSAMINHEKIHIRQQLELLVFPFFAWYGLEFLVRWFLYKDKKKAYRNISFEREAYTKEKDLNYLKKRSFWSFLKYLS